MRTMKTRGGKISVVLLVGGAALVILGAVLSYPRLVPYVETLFYTQNIPTAPPLVVTPTQESALEGGAGVLMPFEGETLRNSEVTPTPTPVPSATPTPEPDATSTPTLPPQPSATPTEVWLGTGPTQVSIPQIELDAPVVPIGWKIERVGGQEQAIWDVPDYRAAGWHNTSANLGVPGNTVLNGHNTSKGEVFRYLYRVEPGAQVFVKGEDGEVYVYRVEEKYILREAGQPIEVRLENARYIQDTPDERLTFVTCHPYGSLANRLVLIAYPVRGDQQDDGAS